jgi:hypothetical protein
LEISLSTWDIIWIRTKYVQPAGTKPGAQNACSTNKEICMRRINQYIIRKENLFEMLHARRHHPCLEITYRDRTGEYPHKISAGYGDDLDVYREGPVTYILTRNPNLGYIGLEMYEGPDKIGEVFVEAERVTEILGRNDLAPFNIIKRLREYII